MVGTRAAAEAIFSFACANPKIPIILDPVLRSSSGFLLLAKTALPAYRRLIKTASVLTPNFMEAEKLLDRKISSFQEAIDAASALSETAGAAVVLKGGHFPWKGRKGVDIIACDGKITLIPPVETRRTDPHGTGCALAAGIAARMAAGDAVVPAVSSAKSVLAKLVDGGFPSAEGRFTLFA
jgi:hydroxymethylpyrimidine/phosphomethylpyrimidine kinase